MKHFTAEVIGYLACYIFLALNIIIENSKTTVIFFCKEKQQHDFYQNNVFVQIVLPSIPTSVMNTDFKHACWFRFYNRLITLIWECALTDA